MASPIKASFGSVHLLKPSLYKIKLSALLLELLCTIINTNDALIKHSFHFYGYVFSGDIQDNI